MACTAVGSYFNDDAYWGGTLAERWDGTSWTIQSTPNHISQMGSNGLTAVSCVSGAVCTAVGSWWEVCDVHTGPCPPVGLAERWEDGRWSIQRIHHPDTARPLSAVSCPSTTSCTALTNSSYAYPGTATWRGADWTVQPPNVPPTGPPTLPSVAITGLADISCPSTTACTAVGSREAWGIGLPLTLRYS
jgi:hypothetical protein